MKTLALLLALAVTASAVEVSTLLTPAEITASGSTPALRAEALKGQGTVILAAKSTSGTSPTLAVALQSSPAESRLFSVPATGAGLSLRTAADANVTIAAKQSFTAARQISSVVLPLKKGAGLTNGNLVLSIQGNTTNNLPDGTSVASVTNAAAAVTTNFAGVTFAFPAPVNVTTNATVWFVLSGTYTANASNNVTWQNATVASNGIAATSTNGTNYAAVATNDLGLAIDGFNFTTLHTFTTVTNAASVQTREFNLQDHGVLRATYTIGGTDTPKFGASAVLVNP